MYRECVVQAHAPLGAEICRALRTYMRRVQGLTVHVDTVQCALQT